MQCEGVSGDAMMREGPDKCLLVLLKHCKDMKQQEVRLRITTVLVLFSCSAVYLYTNFVGSMQRPTFGAQEKEGADVPSPAYSIQPSPCSTDSPKRLLFHLVSVPTDLTTSGGYLNWKPKITGANDMERRCVMIPQTGFYFVHVMIALSCQAERESQKFHPFFMKMNKWNEGYNSTVNLMDIRDGVTCTQAQSKSVFVGQIFELVKGDHIKQALNVIEYLAGQSSLQEKGADVPSPAYSIQPSPCSTDSPKRLLFHLVSVPTDLTTSGGYLNWKPKITGANDMERRCVMIPQTGFYFVHVMIALSCQAERESQKFHPFFMKMNKWNEGYNSTVNLMDIRDGVTCTQAQSKSVFVGQIFELVKGDHISMSIIKGYSLIMRASFGGFLI
ncbi:uncharacterized protein ACBR49_014635 [Aulostomus maculatus]